MPWKAILQEPIPRRLTTARQTLWLYSKTRDAVSRNLNPKVDATIRERRPSTEFKRPQHLWFCRRSPRLERILPQLNAMARYRAAQANHVRRRRLCKPSQDCQLSAQQVALAAGSKHAPRRLL